MVSIAIANRAPILARAIEEALDGVPAARVLGTTATVEEAVGLLRGAPDPALVVDADLLPDTAPGILQALGRMRVVVLVNDFDERWLERVAAIPAAAYLTMDSSRDDLARALSLGGHGRVLVHAALPRARVAQLWSGRGPSQIRRGRAGLSIREAAVLRTVSQGAPDQQVAVRLGISVATAKAHLRSILRKTQSRNRAGAVAWGFRNGVLR